MTPDARAADINRSTIYRNLDELERLNVVDRSRLGHGPAAYHLAPATHGHLVCRERPTWEPRWEPPGRAT